MESRVKVSLNVMPFGSILYQTPRLEQPVQEEEREMPMYVEPLTTNVERVEIRYADVGTYTVPKTTA
jgi:hypothetical protein